MSDIFISYAREDREKARALAALFEAQGWSVWWDRNILAGKSFDREIEAALAAAKCVVVLWSNASVGSDWVKGEAGEGAARKALIPVRIDSAVVPLEFRRLQTADLSDWDNDPGHPELIAFLKAIAAQIQAPMRTPVIERRTPPGRHLRLSLLLLAISVAVIAGIFALWKLRATPTVSEEVNKTPVLGIEFWQDNQSQPIYPSREDASILRVELKPAPFQIHYPHRKADLQLCAGTDLSVFNQIAAGKEISDVPYFNPGTGMAEGEFGGGRLHLTNEAHHYITEWRSRPIGTDKASLQVNSLSTETEPEGGWPTVCLVFFFNIDENNEVDANEFERVVLDFSK